MIVIDDIGDVPTHVIQNYSIQPEPLEGDITCRGRREGELTIGALVLAQPVIAAKQVQRRVEIRVDLVDSVTDRLQRRAPVRRLGFPFARRRTQ